MGVYLQFPVLSISSMAWWLYLPWKSPSLHQHCQSQAHWATKINSFITVKYVMIHDKQHETRTSMIHVMIHIIIHLHTKRSHISVSGSLPHRGNRPLVPPGFTCLNLFFKIEVYTLYYWHYHFKRSVVIDLICPFICSVNNLAIIELENRMIYTYTAYTMPRTLSNMGPVQLHNMHKNMLIDTNGIIDCNIIDIRYTMK